MHILMYNIIIRVIRGGAYIYNFVNHNIDNRDPFFIAKIIAHISTYTSSYIGKVTKTQLNIVLVDY